MRLKKIVLASAEELKDDRRSFELMLGRLNPQRLWPRLAADPGVGVG